MKALVTMELQLCGDLFFSLCRADGIQHQLGTLLRTGLIRNNAVVIEITDDRKIQESLLGSDVRNTLCCVPILEHGTEEQKRKYLPMLTTGGVLGGMGITEPNAGSDASKSQTRARLAGDHYVINDSKIFSSRTAPKRACSSSSP